MEETLYFDSRPSTGYNGYYEFHIDSIPENWVGSLNTDADWVLIYRYDKNQYNILVNSNISDSANTEPRSCIVSGHFETVANEIYSATTGESVVITINQSGNTLPNDYVLVPIELTAFQNPEKDWSYVIENCSDELMDYVSAASVSIMYSKSDGETRKVSPDEIIAASGNSGYFEDSVMNAGSPVISINTESPLEIISDSKNLHYFTVPSYKKISNDDILYHLNIDSVDYLSYSIKKINIKVTSDADGEFALYAAVGFEIPESHREWRVRNIGQEETFEYEITFSSVSASAVEYYTISGSTRQLYGNQTCVKQFTRDTERYIKFGIRKRGYDDYDYSGQVTIGSGVCAYDISYQTNYSADYVKFSAKESSENPVISRSCGFDSALTLDSACAQFATRENTAYGNRSLSIEAVLNDGNTMAPKATIYVTQSGREPEIAIIAQDPYMYDYNATGGYFSITLQPDDAEIVYDKIQYTGGISSVNITPITYYNNVYKCEYTFVGNNTGASIENSTVTVFAAIEEYAEKSKVISIKRNFNHDIVLNSVTFNADSGRHVIDTENVGFDVEDNYSRVRITINRHGSYPGRDIHSIIYVESANNRGKNITSIPTNSQDVYEEYCHEYMILNEGIEKVMYHKTAYLSFNQDSISEIFGNVTPPSLEPGDYLNVYIISYENSPNAPY